MKNLGSVKTMVIAGIAGAVVFAPAAAQAVAPNPNPWLPLKFLNIAHQGGEDEAPSNTLFALKSAVRDRGADMLELDVNLSEDGELMVIHDDSVDRTTNGPTLRDDTVLDTDMNPATDSSEVDQLTVAQIQALDAGFTFREDGVYTRTGPPEDFPYRGIASGANPPPAGYVADDFQIPTLREVLNAFPTTPINIEIKMEKTIGATQPGGGCETEPSGTYCDDYPGSLPIAQELAEVLDDPAYEGRQDILVVSFSEPLTQEFRNNDTQPWTPLAPAAGDASAFALGNTQPNPDVAAFQVPPTYFNGTVDSAALLMSKAPQAGYAVHIFPSGNDEPEGVPSYRRLVALGVNGYMASKPLQLHNYLCTAGVRRPDGSARCPAQILPPVIQPTIVPTTPQKTCKKGQKLKKGKCVKKKKKKGKKKN